MTNRNQENIEGGLRRRGALGLSHTYVRAKKGKRIGWPCRTTSRIINHRQCRVSGVSEGEVGLNSGWPGVFWRASRA